jgi:hypothetical protein
VRSPDYWIGQPANSLLSLSQKGHHDFLLHGDEWEFLFNKIWNTEWKAVHSIGKLLNKEVNGIDINHFLCDS